MRLIVFLPVASLTVMILLVGLSSLRNGPAEESPQDGRPQIAKTRVAAIHNQLGTCYGVTLWLALPLSLVLPLTMGWRNIRRKVLAVLGMSICTLSILVFSLLASFTGYFLGKEDWEQGHSGHGILERLKALHIVGFPILLSLALGVLWVLTIRLASRADPGVAGSGARILS